MIIVVIVDPAQNNVYGELEHNLIYLNISASGYVPPLSHATLYQCSQETHRCTSSQLHEDIEGVYSI